MSKPLTPIVLDPDGVSKTVTLGEAVTIMTDLEVLARRLAKREKSRVAA